MQTVEAPAAGQSRLPKLVCTAGPDPTVAAPRRSTALRLASFIAHRLAAAIRTWRERRRARRRLESWLTMDPRTLADLGLRPADVQAMVYAGGRGAQLAARGGRWHADACDNVIDARTRAHLRIVGGDDLDAAA
jgi:uncharacterized protein YjiS (DUF1127 family)